MREQNSHSPLSLFYKSVRYCLFCYFYFFFVIKMMLMIRDAAIGKRTNKIFRL